MLLKVVLAAIVELSREQIVSECHSILKASFSLLSRACMSGIGEDNVLDNDDNDNDNDDKAICIIENLLGILVVCAGKRLLLRNDYERLVPACKASLSRFTLSRKLHNHHNHGNSSTHSSNIIPMRVVQLIEAEDATVGLWLRETYGIPRRKKNEIENRRPLQETILLAMQHQQHRQQTLLLLLILVVVVAPGNNHNESSRQDSIPTPPQPVPKFRSSIFVCDPDQKTKDESTETKTWGSQLHHRSHNTHHQSCKRIL